MFCKVCNKEIADGSKFCMFCGSGQDVQQHTVPEAPAAPLTPAAPVMPEEFCSEQPKPRKRLGLILGLVGGLAAVALVVVLVLSLGGGNGPWDHLADAMENTFEDGNFTFDLTAAVDDEFLQIHGMMDVDLQERELSLYMETELDGEKAQFVIHDGRQMSYTDGYWDYGDISQDLPMLFFSLQSLQQPTDQSAAMDGEDIMNMLMITNPELYSELSMLLKMDKLDAVIEDLGRNFCDEEWLATYMGYKSFERAGETVYRFDLDVTKLAEGVLLTMESAFVDRSMCQTLIRELQNGAGELSELEFVMELRVDGSYLTGMYYGVELYGEGGTFDIYFSNPGSTEIPEDMLEALLDEAERNAWN